LVDAVGLTHNFVDCLIEDYITPQALFEALPIEVLPC